MKGVQDYLISIPTLTVSDTVTKARKILRDDVFREIYVADSKKELAGYIDITDVLRITSTKSNVTVDGFLKDAPFVTPGDSIEGAVIAIKSFKTDSAAVVGPGMTLIGAVLLSDLFPVIINRKNLQGRVSDFMTRKVMTCCADDPLQKVYTTILECGYNALPVIRKKRLVGIVSRRDLLREGHLRPSLGHPADTPVYDLMTQQVISVTPDDTIQDAADLLVRNNIGRLPVVEDMKLVGILDRHDVLSGV